MTYDDLYVYLADLQDLTGTTLPADAREDLADTVANLFERYGARIPTED